MLSSTLVHFALIISLSGVQAAVLRPRGEPLVCYEDNQLRELEGHSAQANRFCLNFLSQGGDLPQWLGQWSTQQVSSACACYAKTASGISTAATAAATTGSGSAVYPTASGAYLSSAISPGTGLPSMTASTYGMSTSKVALQPSASIADRAILSSTASTVGTPSAISVAPSSTAATASASASPTDSGNTYPPQPPGAGPGKRGLVYDYNTQVGWSNFFDGSKYVTYGSNWNVNRGDQLDGSFAYVPTIAVDANLNNADWNNSIPVLLEGGTKALFASNEPDNASQANLTPSQAATVYKNYMQPYYGEALLGTPAVTNGGGATGLNYLEAFVGVCTDCKFNFINIHYYLQRSDVNTTQFTQALKDYIDIDVPAVQAKYPQLQGLQIFIGEWWLWDASEAEGGDLMDDLLPYLDGNANVMGYQAFGGLWEGNFISSDGTGLTPAGQKYNTYSAAPAAATGS